jgi:hypothetical protein
MIQILIIVLDGMPFLPMQISEFEKLKIEWTLHLVHGAANNKGSTAWCKSQIPRFSRDGTSEFINGILKHPRIKVYQRQLWVGGKDEMVNKPLQYITEPCVLFTPDVDEIFTANQIEKIVQLFEERPDVMRMYFYCRYFLGEKIISTSTNGYGNRLGEWLRAFRFTPGMTFSQHEPPVLAGNSRGISLGRDVTRGLGLVFDHFAWQLESQAIFKEKFYGYKDAAACWRRLQENKTWPVADLRIFLPWTGDGASADLVK